MGTKKLKISSAKRANHIRQKKGFSKQNRSDTNKLKATLTSKQQKNELTSGPDKNTRPKKKKKEHDKSVPNVPKFPEPNDDSDVEPDDVLDMLETDDLGYMSAMNFLNTNFDTTDKSRNKRKRSRIENNDADEHELEHSEQSRIAPNKIMKALLPIKTKDGNVVERSMKIEKPIREKITKLEEEEVVDESSESEASIDTEDELLKDDDAPEDDELLKSSKSISTADLLIKREQEINKQKYRIGIICSGILEKPEDKMKNFTPLLEFMEYRNSEGHTNLTTIRKIATLSVLELFKDIIPEYRVGFIDLEKTKVKKHTMERVNFENELLRHYKKYLQKMEHFTAPIGKKRKNVIDPNDKSSDVMVMAELAVKCLCELLLAHPYFNFSQNIAQMLVYLANSRSSTIRETIRKTIIEIYKTDQRFDLSLFIIRRTNHLIKSKSNNVYVEVIETLLALPLKNINLDADKEKELKQKRLEAHKARIMNLSKKEKKRQKKLKEVDKELQETQAEENKKSKHFKLTEITKMMFTIYFRILKNDPNSKLLSSTLEGLAKFAHIINIDFFEDLVNTLNYLMEYGELGYREQLHCIQTVFIILSGQGEIFNIDPCRFYTHLYKNLLEVNAGRNHGDLLIIIKTLTEVVIKRRKHITHQRLAAFVKRIATLSLQVQHNGTLGLLTIIKNSLQFNSTLEILLDTDNSIGSGRYDPELNEPEYCNAKCTALYEVSALTRHYHPTVKKIAKHIAAGIPSTGEGSLNPEFSKLSPVDYYLKYDSSEMAFNPPIPAPKNVQAKARPGRHIFLNDEIENYCKNKLKAPAKAGENFNFCIDYWNSLEANK